MKFSLLKVFAFGSVVPLAVALNACGDDSSTSGSSDGGNRGGIPDTVETFMELSDYDCGKSQKCVATYLTEYHDMAVCDGNNGWVIGTLIEKMDCDFSSSSDKSSDSKSNDPAGVTDDSSDSKDEAISSSAKTESNGSSDSKNADKDKVNCSALLEENGWSWDVPKECRFKPNIDYGFLSDSRDGQVYRTVKIGNQVWMAENLNYADSITTPSLLGKSWCFDNDSSKCAVAGRLYTWAAAIDSVKLYDGGNGVDCGYGRKCSLPTKVQGICPSGWHLPSEDEWSVLLRAEGGQLTAGYALKSTSGWKNRTEGVSGNGSDVFGFSALPVGFRDVYESSFFSEGSWASFLSSTEYDIGNIYKMSLSYMYGKAELYQNNKHNASSVRCIKDSD